MHASLAFFSSSRCCWCSFVPFFIALLHAKEMFIMIRACVRHRNSNGSSSRYIQATYGANNTPSSHSLRNVLLAVLLQTTSNINIKTSFIIILFNFYFRWRSRWLLAHLLFRVIASTFFFRSFFVRLRQTGFSHLSVFVMLSILSAMSTEVIAMKNLCFTRILLLLRQILFFFSSLDFSQMDHGNRDFF